MPVYNVTAWDFCCLCKSYDTIQTHIPDFSGKIHASVYVCEKCLANNTLEQLQVKLYGKKPLG